jgi:hypothetical protein
MLARVQKACAFISVLSFVVLTLAGCKTDNVATATPTTATTTTTSIAPAPSLALARPEAQIGLVGHDSNAILAAYGKPAFVRKEADAELWRYDGVHCAAFFFLYKDQDGLRVRHVETLPQGQLTTVDDACLAGIKARAAATS